MKKIVIIFTLFLIEFPAFCQSDSSQSKACFGLDISFDQLRHKNRFSSFTSIEQSSLNTLSNPYIDYDYKNQSYPAYPIKLSIYYEWDSLINISIGYQQIRFAYLTHKQYYSYEPIGVSSYLHRIPIQLSYNFNFGNRMRLVAFAVFGMNKPFIKGETSFTSSNSFSTLEFSYSKTTAYIDLGGGAKLKYNFPSGLGLNLGYSYSYGLGDIAINTTEEITYQQDDNDPNSIKTETIQSENQLNLAWGTLSTGISFHITPRVRN